MARLSQGRVREKRVAATVTPSSVREAGAITFTLPEPPSANRWWRKFRNRMVLSPEAREYKSLVCLAYRRAELRGPIAVEVVWYRGIRSGDLDKRLGVVLDALQGVAYVNDSQITHLTARRIDDPRKARVVVTVGPAPISPLSPSSP